LLSGDVFEEFLWDSVIGKKPHGWVVHIEFKGVGRKAKEKEAVLLDACHSDALCQGNEELIRFFVDANPETEIVPKAFIGGWLAKEATVRVRVSGLT
jgi:hypothetical protein